MTTGRAVLLLSEPGVQLFLLGIHNLLEASGVQLIVEGFQGGINVHHAERQVLQVFVLYGGQLGDLIDYAGGIICEAQGFGLEAAGVVFLVLLPDVQGLPSHTWPANWLGYI